MNKTTLVVGASENPERYSNKAIHMLQSYQHKVLAFGKRKGQVSGIPIETDIHMFKHSPIHTVTLYVNASNQAPMYQDILDLKPQRVIFNPGAENDEFQELLQANHIEYEEACTLVLLRTGQF